MDSLYKWIDGYKWNENELDDVIGACNVLKWLLNCISMQLSQFIQFVASFYIYFEAISFHLITRGFVNPIPEYTNAGQNDSDKGPENFEPSGIGDGETTGAKVIITRITTYDNLITIVICSFVDQTQSNSFKDVGDQIENIEQIEGLKVPFFLCFMNIHQIKG